jgi:hypothetical protein
MTISGEHQDPNLVSVELSCWEGELESNTILKVVNIRTLIRYIGENIFSEI